MQVIGDRFEVERLVGSGGMGEVYRARDRLSGGLAAVKVLHGAMGKDVERFRREAQLLAEVSHPRVVKYVAHGVTPAGRPYLAMEWLDGEDLAERLTRSGLTLQESFTLARRVAESLGALHDRGIVHRDIKPSNLFLPAGSVDAMKLLDLGVARLIHATRRSTRSGVMVGTPGYMAPEQARGAREIDARADVFSLGCVMYECISGQPAFSAENIAALLAKILLEEPPSLRDANPAVPAELDELIARMLAKHPTARPANGLAVLRELEQVTIHHDTGPQRPSTKTTVALTASERRLVSVVMASASSEVAVDDEPAPASSFETVAASFDIRSVVASFGAESELLADGSIVVTLVGKGAASDQVAHAVRCALALRSHLVTPIVSLATGLATVTGRSVVGDVIERAAALITLARGSMGEAGDDTLHGQSPVFLDETTAGLLDTRFDVGGDDRGLFVRGLRERETKPRTLLGMPTPCVGRDRELGTLSAILEECVYEPVSRAVLVTGVPGAGKSRVATEFLARARESFELELLMARGDPMSEGAPFGLLARAICRAAGIVEGEALVARQQKLRARLGRHVREPDLTRVAEFVGEIASVSFPDSASVQLRAARTDSVLMGDQMKRALVDWLRAECEAQPVLLVLEDLHWGDLPTVNLVDAALRALDGHPFMVLAVARTEVHESFPQLWAQRSLQEIRLGALVRRAGERLVREVLPDVSPAVVGQLLDRAAGNVFYLEELVRAYAEGTGRRTPRSGSLPPEPSSATSLGSQPSWSLPGTVLAMVEARLERLDPMARRILRAASVYGECFWRGGVLALMGGELESTEVDEWVAEMVSREILLRRDVSRFPAEPELCFRHAIVRDAAYAMLTEADLELGHRLAAEWLELAGEHEPVVLAEHWERGAQLERASVHYARAATQALEGNDFEGARASAERALAAAPLGVTRAKLHTLLAELGRWESDHDGAREHARAAMAASEPGSDAWCAAVAEHVDASVATGSPKEAIALSRELVEVLDRSAPTAARVTAAARVAERVIFVGELDSVDAVLSWVNRRGQTVVESDPGARAFVFLARLNRAKWRGNLEDAAVFAQEAVDCFEVLGDARNASMQRQEAAFALMQLGAFPMAARIVDEAVAQAERLGLPSVILKAKLRQGQLQARMEQRERAVRTLEEAIQGFAAIRNPIEEGIARAYFAGAMHLAGQHVRAQEEAMVALPLLERCPPYRAGLLGLVALTRLDSGDVPAALEAATEAMRLLRELGGTLEGEAIIRVAYAETLNASGDRAGALVAIREARDWVLERAAGVKNPEWRRGFVDRIREHLRLLARAGEWLV